MAAKNLDMNTSVAAAQEYDPRQPAQQKATAAQVAPVRRQAAPPAGKPTARGPRINPGNLVLIGLFAAGIGGLYLLSLRSGPPTASADEQVLTARIDAALLQMQAPALASDDETSAVIDTFYYEAKQRQIPISMLSGNAFVYRPPSLGPTAGSDRSQRSPGGAEHQADPYAIDAVKQLKLQCVMKGGHGATAMISNTLVTEGQVIKGWTAKSIKPREVLLTRGGMEYVLRMPR